MKKILRSVKDFFRPRTPTGHPWDLKSEQVAALKSLRGTEGYRELQSLIDTVAMLETERLLSTEDREDVERLRGFVTGLRRAGTLVDEILQKEELKDAERRNREQQLTERATDRSAIFGTRAWGLKP